jgi:RNA polymerase sigma factor (sigma-70 family)
MVEFEQFKAGSKESIEEKLRELPSGEHAHTKMLEMLYEKMNPFLRVYLARMWPRSGSVSSALDVEDLLQETWIKAFRYLNPDRMSHIDNFRALLLCIARNTMLDHTRRASWRTRGAPNRLESSLEDEEQSGSLSTTVDPEEPEPSEKASRREAHDVLCQAIQTLPSHQQEVIHLRMNGMSQVDIAELLGIQPATVRQHYCRAVQRLREILEEKGWRDGDQH